MVEIIELDNNKPTSDITEIVSAITKEIPKQKKLTYF